LTIEDKNNKNEKKKVEVEDVVYWHQYKRALLTIEDKKNKNEKKISE